VRVNVERRPGSTVSIDIFADDDEFAVAVDKAYRKIARDVTLPGFRKGKAPRHIIEGMIGRDAIVEEAGRDMMEDLYRRAFEQESLIPVGEPQVGLLQAEPIGFNVVIEVFPTVTLGDYRSVRVEPREVTVEESEVEDVLDQLQKTHAEFIPLETPRMPIDGDQIVIDMEVYDGEELFQPPATDSTFILGESAMFESIAEAIKMMMPGSTAELTLAFDEDDETVNPQLWGKTLRYVITLKEVNTRVLPERDDALAAKVGDFATFDELIDRIREDLLRNKAVETRAAVVTEVINAMAETCEVEVPKAMVDKEIESEVMQFRSRLAQQGIQLEQYLQTNRQTLEDLQEEIRPNAARRIRNSVVLQEIAKAEELVVTDEDIAGEIERMAGPAENADRLRTLYQSDYFRGLLENEMFDRKVSEHVVSIATEGRGAITGPGAELLEADRQPQQAGTASTPDEDGARVNGDVAAATLQQDAEVAPAAEAAASEDVAVTEGSAMAAEAVEAEMGETGDVAADAEKVNSA
jgi:trigger factor